MCNMGEAYVGVFAFAVQGEKACQQTVPKDGAIEELPLVSQVGGNGGAFLFTEFIQFCI